MTWAFQPLLPGAAHQQSDPNAVAINEAASAGDSCGVTVSYGVSKTEISTLGGVDISKGFMFPANASAAMEYLRLANETTGTTSFSFASRRQGCTPATTASAGYAMGAHWGSGFDSIYKLSYATEGTAAITATLPTATGLMAGWSSSTKGYGGGGVQGGVSTDVITALTFSGETTADTSAVLSVSRGNSAAVYSSTVGYALGGRYSTSRYSDIDGLTFSGETATNPSAAIKAVREGQVGLQSSTVGYTFGGYNGSTYTGEIESFTFSTETVGDPSAALTNPKWLASSFMSSTHGYVGGGDDGSSWQTDIDKFQFSNSTITALSASYTNGSDSKCGLTYVATTAGGASESSNGSSAPAQTADITQTASPSESSSAALGYVATITEQAQDLTKDAGTAYFGGGTGIDGAGVVSVAFSNEAVATNIATLDTSGIESSGASSETKGYFWGGQSRQAISTLVFSNLTSTTLSATTGSTQYGMASFSGADCGYFCGRNNTDTDLIAALMFGSETVRTLSATLPTGRGLGSGVKSATKGYVLGGYISTFSAEIDGLVFATEAIVNPSAALSVARYSGGGVQSATIGYCLGGEAGGGTSAVVDGIRFSDEAAVNGANGMYEAAGRGGSASSYSAGYLANPNVANATYCHKIAFFNEATSVLAASVLNRNSSCGVQKNLYAARGAFDSPQATSSEPVSISEGASSVGAQAATYTTSSDVTEAAASGGTQAATAVFVAADTEAGSATAAHPVTMVAVSAQQDSATATDAPVGLPTYPAARVEAASSTDEQDGVVPGLSVAIEEAATAAAAHPVTAAFVSAITEAGSSTAAQVGGFLVNDPESMSAAEAGSATITFTLAGTGQGSAGDAATVAADFVVATTQAASATDAPAGYADFTAAGDATGVATDSPNSSVTIVVLEQTTATDSADAAPRWVGYIIETATATAVFNGTGPVPANATELVAATTTQRVYRYLFADADSALSADVIADALRYCWCSEEEIAAAVSSQSGTMVAVSSRPEQANGTSWQSATLGQDVSALEIGTATEAEIAVAILAAAINGAASATSMAEAVAALSGISIEFANAADVTTGGRKYASSILALTNAQDFSDAALLDLLPNPLPAVIRVVRIGTTAYVFSGDEFRDLKFSNIARIIAEASTERTVKVSEKERSIAADTTERNVIFEESDRRIVSDE